MRILRPLALSLLSLFAASGLGAQEDGRPATVALLPDAVVGADGALEEGVHVVVRGDRIVAVGEAPQGARVVRLRGVLSAGMVDAFGVGSRRVTDDAWRTSPDLRAADGLDLDAERWTDLLAQGVTTVHRAPEPSNVLSGWGARVVPGDPARVADAELGFVASLAASWVADARRGPSSSAGARELLADRLPGMASALAGHPLFVVVAAADEVRAARELAAEAGLAERLVFVAHGDAGSYLGAARGSAVCLPAPRGGSDLARRAETWRRLHDAGFQPVFGTLDGAGDPGALRRAAQLWARATRDPASAWAAVTSRAAAVLGLEGEVGSLTPGARADLVLWSGHPLDAASRVLAVTVGGEPAWSRLHEPVPVRTR